MKRGRIFLLLALLLILALVVGGYIFLRPMLEIGGTVATPTFVPPTPTPVDMVKVVIVTQRVPRGTPLTADVLDYYDYPKDKFFAGMITDVNEVVGQLARIDLESSFILTRNMVVASLEGQNTGSDWALRVPPGMVAVSIPIDVFSSVSYAPRSGDHVNVIATLLFIEMDAEFQARLPNTSAQVLGPSVTETSTTISAQVMPGAATMGHGELDLTFEQPFYVTSSEAQRPRMVSQTLIQDVVVLQVGRFPLERVDAEGSRAPDVRVEGEPQATPTPAPAAAQPNQPAATPTPEPEPERPELITLIVSPQNAVTLNYLVYSGAKLTLALRNPNDNSTVPIDAVNLQYLLDQYNIPIPVKLPYGLEPRIDVLENPDVYNVVPTPPPQ